MPYWQKLSLGCGFVLLAIAMIIISQPNPSRESLSPYDENQVVTLRSLHAQLKTVDRYHEAHYLYLETELDALKEKVAALEKARLLPRDYRLPEGKQLKRVSQ